MSRETAADVGTVGGVAAPDRDVVVVRPRKMLIASWVGAVVTVALFVAIAVVLRAVQTGVYFRFADQVAIVLLGLFIAGGLLLFARPRVRADAEGIEVRNLLGPRRFAWSEVRQVSFPDGARWARLELPADEYIPMLAIQAFDGERAVAVMRELRRLHREAR